MKKNRLISWILALCFLFSAAMAEGASAYDAAEQLGMGGLVAESLGGAN